MRRLVIPGALLALIPFGWWLRAQVAATVPPMAADLPAGALLYLEAKDFGKLLGEWNSSAEKAKWVGSANYDVLSRSRLIGRLQQAQGELEQTSGVSAQMKLLEQVAGTRSAFAFYNLGALKFVYLTHLDHGRIEASDLWKQRAQYQPREAAGLAFYVKQDQQSGRTVAFASKDGLFALATDESLMATMLELLAGQSAPSLAKAEWFENITTGRRQGDLRLVYDLRTLEKTPQFRSYWIQENETELNEYAAGISDLFETGQGFEEQRVLARAEQAAAPNTSGAIETLVSAVAPADSLYRAWANPSQGQIAASLEQVVYGEGPAPNPLANQMAPTAAAGFVQRAYAPGLETRIDQPPISKEARKPIDRLIETVAAMQPTALLHVQSTVELRDGVFIVPGSAVVIACGRADAGAAEQTLHNMLGAAVESGGLDPLTVRAEGNVLVIGRGTGLVGNPGAKAPATAETYAAGYNHAAEWPRYTRLFRLIDGPAGGVGAQGRPAFFSSNMQSLGDAAQPSATGVSEADGYRKWNHRDDPVRDEMISRRGLLALPGLTLMTSTTRGPEYLALDLLSGKKVSRWEQPDKAVSMGSLLKPFLIVAYSRTYNSFPELLCHGSADGCWLPRGHGRQDVVAALANSCNFYFRLLATELNSAALRSVCLSYGLDSPRAQISADELIGLGKGWPQRPSAVLSAFARLSREESDHGVELALTGMQRSTERGTTRGLGLRARGKTGTAPCSHTPRSEGDGYTTVLYPLDRVRLVLLARQCGTTGAHTAQLVRPILQTLL